MKKNYTEASISIIRIEENDIITQSPEAGTLPGSGDPGEAGDNV